MTALIIHERHAVYVHAFRNERKLVRHMPKANWFHYTIGEMKPNFPLPVPIDNAEKALNYLTLSLCPFIRDGLPCRVCADQFTDAIEYDYL